jgi:putative ABC transport system substrate-binding protein
LRIHGLNFYRYDLQKPSEQKILFFTREGFMNRFQPWHGAWKILSVLLLLILLTPPFFANADDIKRVVAIVTMPVPACKAHLKSFVAELTDLVDQDGQNMDLSVIRANGDREFAEDQLRGILKKGKPDAVAAIATIASQAALNVLKNTDVAIFFFQVSDPVGAGLIKKVGDKTGTNVTGRVFTVPARVRIDLAMRLAGQAVSENRAVRFGYIHSTYPSAAGDIRALKTVAKQRKDIEFETYSIPYQKVPKGTPAMLTAVEDGIGALADKVDFWWQPQGPLGEMAEYTQLLFNHSTVPVIMGQTLKSVKTGALVHITPDIEAEGREAAKWVHAILKGYDPGNIRVTSSQVFELGINLATALKLNIVVPPDILDLAGDNVYR